MTTPSAPTKVVVALYDGFTALDVVGPYQVLAFTPGVEVTFAAERPGSVVDDRRSLSLQAVGLDHVGQPDVVLVPGGPGTAAALGSGLPRWLGEVHSRTAWTTSVCSGSLILAAAGVLAGVRATSHFLHLDTLAALGAVVVRERVVEEPSARVMTAAGVSSGIDMALRLSELLSDRITAEAVQLWTEYDPQPPFDSGSPDKASPAVLARAREYDAAALAEWTVVD
ncbi:DJ-1/PfpI family protein [Nocardioides antri]|uniref:DJ-1/PfpI family protein n=1 Tax=Nocardioides antri TaxID=2607659 RepID=A0A5B1M4R4_9ACTN|nr:DJ-1/PfpI family protein [Nocardioides antri]KAA1426787.1 DJ-1/PfpI family protein [Nocardioides antri]